jgi:hypothetical protein
MGSQQYYRPNAFAGRSFSSYTAGPSTPSIGASGAASPDYFQHAHAHAHSRSNSLPSADVVSSPVAEGWKGAAGVAEVDEESQKEKVAAMEEHQRRFAEARDR